MGNTSSLVTRLTLLLGATLVAIWLISIATNAFFSFENTRHRLIEDLTHVAMLRADLSNQQFEGAERDANLLVHRREHYQTQKEAPLPQSSNSYDSFYIPLVRTGSCTSPENSDDCWVIQAYGAADQTYYLDSFIMNRGTGIALLPPQKISKDYLAKRRRELFQLPAFPTHGNVFWGTPVYTPNNGWHVSVAVCGKNGILAGFALKLNGILSYGQSTEQKDINLLLDSNGDLLPISQQAAPAAQLDKILEQLGRIKLHDGWQQSEDYLIFRTQLKGPGWQQLVIYPRLGFAWEAAKPALHQLPFALAILVLLTLALFFLLRYYLAIPLSNFVNIIGATGPDAMDARLPIIRADELGHIARAYNHLLDTLNEQYDTLELKVKERTLELAEAKQEAEQASSRKSLHLTTISHEIRTPLNGSLGAIELLQNTPLSPAQSRLADTARLCSLSLLGIINDLLDFSRIESGQMMLALEETALLPLLDHVMLAIQSSATTKSLTLYTQVGQDVPLKLQLDALRLRQILINLLGNAVKFTESGNISLHVKRKNDKLCFIVEDTGCGIDAANQQKIFEPFFQSGTHGQGTGLGLAIASNLAKLMQGTLQLQSTPDLGTRVSLLLPLNETRASLVFSGSLAAPALLHPQLTAWGITCLLDDDNEHLSDAELAYLPGRLYARVKRLLFEYQPQTPAALPIQPWRMKILLVDDAETNRDITGMMLTQLGHHVELAESGERALELGRQQYFDLVLMDIRMLGLDGLETTVRWRADEKNKDRACMITALTANASPAEKERVQQAGMNDYLSKPVTMAQLAEMLDLAAQFQLQRDIVLSPQLSASKSILDLTDQNFTLKIHQALLTLIQQVAQSIDDPAALSHYLHTLKGCAGQAGLTELWDSTSKLEARIHNGDTVTPEDIEKLDQIISLVTESKL
ncbi:two component system sensor kinase [Candidatus Fukatsuia symbiotica]|uniref:two component system sensor kinase n=1 Tax=Candidatus Fukatsuia TaxID=1927833 RepID=UPI000933DCD1|nr:two component system sensor kinase [Candidatus Fukatsuia symbiotica]MEA9445679.1 two component system sensor kinase [Candidatus Fukatsuia symbiotica]